MNKPEFIHHVGHECLEYEFHDYTDFVLCSNFSIETIIRFHFANSKRLGTWSTIVFPMAPIIHSHAHVLIKATAPGLCVCASSVLSCFFSATC